MPIVGDKAEALIVGQEIGSFATYTKLYQHLDWPGGESGCTGGIGYDFGQHTAAQIRADWTGHLSDADVTALCSVAGIKGTAAKARLASVQAVIIPIAVAYDVFTKSTLPKYANETAAELKNCDLLPPDAFGALVSLSYNRGPGGYSDEGDRYTEMNDIADAMERKAFAEIPPLFVKMKRLWAVNSDLWKRRQAEADLFKAALAAPVVSSKDTTPAPVPVAVIPPLPVTVAPSLVDQVTGFFKSL